MNSSIRLRSPPKRHRQHDSHLQRFSVYVTHILRVLPPQTALSVFWHLRGSQRHVLMLLLTWYLLGQPGISLISGGMRMIIMFHLGFASICKSFDSSLGYPGEGPPFQQCMVCGLTGHNRRTCVRASPYPVVPMVTDETCDSADISMGASQTEAIAYEGAEIPSTPMQLAQPVQATPTPVHVHPQALDPGLPLPAMGSAEL
eukprot:5960634-Amphidinium_carterae.1